MSFHPMLTVLPCHCCPIPLSCLCCLVLAVLSSVSYHGRTIPIASLSRLSVLPIVFRLSCPSCHASAIQQDFRVGEKAVSTAAFIQILYQKKFWKHFVTKVYPYPTLNCRIFVPIMTFSSKKYSLLKSLIFHIFSHMVT
jgi:hypothetical protein